MMALGADLMQSRFAAPAKKLRGHRRGLLNALSFSVLGGAGVYMPAFPITEPFRFCFFHSAQAPSRVSQNDSSGRQFFLVNWLKKARYIRSHAVGGAKNAGNSSPQSSRSSLRKMRSCVAGAQAQRRVPLPRASDRARGRAA